MSNSIIVLLVLAAAVFVAGALSYFGNPDRKKKPLAVDINDYELPPGLPMLRFFKVVRSTEQSGDVIRVTWTYRTAKSYRAFDVDPNKTVAENQAAFAVFCRDNEFKFYLRNKELFPLRKGKKK